MITKFKLEEHTVRKGQVVELWFGPVMVGQITPTDDGKPGLRVITKHVMDVKSDFMVVQVDILPQTSGRSVIENIPRTKMITILNMMPEEAFRWFVEWAKGAMVTFPDLNRFGEESRASVQALQKAAQEYKP